LTQEGARPAAKKACVACGQEYDASHAVCPQDGTVLTPLVGDVRENIIGKVFADKYEILEQVGTGGMGKVYKAKHLLMKRIVAIKVLLKELVSEAASLQRFQQEAEAASSLNHPHILTIFDFGVSQEALPYIVMDYLEGKSLAAIMQDKNGLEVDRAVGIFVQVCAGLAHAHSKGIVHRDLKPSNIMLITFDNQPDFVKIVDFGIAKLTMQSESESRHLTRTGQVFGSPLYMSPEQCRGGVLDARSDIYSMGCLMYKVLTGQPPIQGESLVDCLHKHCNTMPEPFNAVRPDLDLSAGLEQVIFKTLAKDPAHRYQSMKELREALLLVYPSALSWTFSHTRSQAQTVIVEPNAEKKAGKSGTYDRGEPTADLPQVEPTMNTKVSREIPQSTIAPERGETTTAAPAAPAAPKSSMLAHPIVSIAALVVSLLALGLAFMMFMAKKPAPPVVQAVDTSDRLQLYETYIKNAESQYDRGNYFEAQNNVELALKQSRRISEDDPHTIDGLNLLGKILYSKNDYDTARSTFEHVLAMTDQNRRGKTAAVADALSGLGLIYAAEKKYADALAMLKRAKAIREKLPDGQNDVSDADLATAEVFMRQGKNKDAIQLLNKALAAREKSLGKDHPDVAVVLNDMGQAYQVLGKLPEAEKYYQRAYAIRQKGLGPDNPATADCMILLGTLNYNRGNLNQSRDLLERALTIKENSLGMDSNALPQILRALTIVYTDQKDNDHAEVAIKRALKITQDNLKPSDPEVAKTRLYYAEFLTRTGRKKEAQAYRQ
jgi:serine/threonine-protein kinase